MQIREAIKKNPRIMNLLRMLIRENIFMICSPWHDYAANVSPRAMATARKGMSLRNGLII
jgi:hypothetical protein